MHKRIILADKSFIIRRGLKEMIESIAARNNEGLTIVGEASSMVELHQLILQTQPDVLFLSLQLDLDEQQPRLPDYRSIFLLSALKNRYPEIDIISISPFTAPRLLQLALNAGAGNIISHNVGENCLSLLLCE
ncbi:hypothetical protein BTJ39_05140 [Izhakiella australiensis]|uniref:Response regulatory domain-containing protein n=1 Tax=Izhakiella australiensis TaxID=1926881 RepID=A0A1S8YQC7_9GAMM|nr:response regulator transcription factor [Izhakiella australiensis]OON41349.1 hypothetical protein BTJ39_05140 [Izhakiella australiensis]